MRRVLLDTDTFSDIFAARYPAVLKQADTYLQSHDRLTVSSITVLEVFKGLYSRDSKNRLDIFRILIPEALVVLPFGTEEADLGGQIIAKLEAVGQTIGGFDPIIAATAIRHEFPLITSNIRHYRRIIDLGYPLEIANWRES